jgi:hypothetical protein
VAYEVELILLKQVASYLATPIFLVDLMGTLLFYNEPAEVLLGKRYDETGEMPLEEWGTIFSPTDRDGSPLPPEEIPLAISVLYHRPAFGDLSITGLDGVRRDLSTAAFPLIGQNDRHLGAIAMFWETENG